MDIEITINGKKVLTNSGLTILEAASRAGIRIPVLCYLKRLRPIGSCRICSVEVEGIAHPVPACAARVKEGYNIKTDTGLVRNIRKEALSHLLLDHPLDCPVCDKAGDCLLQDLSFEFGLTRQNNKKLSPPRINIFKSDLIEYMATRCVLCSRCIRVCSEMYGNPFIEIKAKGYEAYIGVGRGHEVTSGAVSSGSAFIEAKQESDLLKCYYCGNCVEVCPVGALISKPSKFKERYWQETPFSSVCDKCSSACRIEYYRYEREESLVRTASAFGGYLCKSGFFYEGIGKGNAYYAPFPTIKKNSEQVESDHEESLEYFVSNIKNIIGKGGLSETALLVSPGMSSNDGKAALLFSEKVLRPAFFDIAASGNYRTNLSVFNSEFADTAADAFDIKTILNSEVILYVGDIENEIPYVSYNIMKTHREHGGKLLLLNNSQRTERASLHRFEDIAYCRADVSGGALNNFLTDVESSLRVPEPDSAGREAAVPNSGSFAAALTEAGTVSVLLGDRFLSSENMDGSLKAVKEIAAMLSAKEKTVYVYPLVKPFNYRGLSNAGINPVQSADFNAVISGMEAGKIKNLIYIGDFGAGSYYAEILKYSSVLEFLAVFSSKTNLLSAMADVVVPVKDFLEERDAVYQNFEGKTISVNNEFNLGGIYRPGITELLADISARLGVPFDFAAKEAASFKSGLKAKGGLVELNRSKPRSRFYYNDKTKIYY